MSQASYNKKDRLKPSVQKPKRSSQIVIKENPQQLAYERAMRDWAAGKIPYSQVTTKDPDYKSYSIRALLLDLLLGPK